MRGRVWGPLAMAIALSAMTASGIVINQGGGSGPPVLDGTANLWVDTSGGTCTRHATVAAYVNAEACGSFDAAYTAASCGDTVRIKGGDYGGQEISAPQKNCSSGQYVVFNPADGEQLTQTSGSLGVEEGDWIKFVADYTVNTTYPTTGYITTNWNITDNGASGSSNSNAGVYAQWRNGGSADHADHIWFEGLSFETFLFRGTDQVTMIYNDIGTGKTGQCDGKNWVSTAYDDTGGGYTNNMADDMEIGWNFIHDFPASCSGAHTECLTGEWHNHYFHHNAFVNCHGTSAAILWGNDGGFATTGTNNRFENNFVENDASNNISLGDTEVGSIVTLKNNSFQGTVTDQLGGSIATLVVTGNVFSSQGISCAGNTFQYNVIQGGFTGTCDATDTTAATGFTSPPLNLHLTATAAARNFVPLAFCAADDIDKEARPIGSATHCDAGADERD